MQPSSLPVTACFSTTLNLPIKPFLQLLLLIALSVSVPTHAADTENAETSKVTLQVRAILQGPYDASENLMRDDLRLKGLIPLTYTHRTPFMLNPDSPIANPELLATTGHDAPVDWVGILLVGPDRQAILRWHGGLLQRDGDVIDSQSGSTVLEFPGLGAGDYFVVLTHRNHLWVMTDKVLALSSTPTQIDFSLSSTAVFGENARFETDGIALMWAGEADTSRSVIAHGPGNDITELQSAVLAADGNTNHNNNFQLKGYHHTDFNMDGITLFVGSGNDSNIVMANILQHPTNKTFATNFIVQGRVPLLRLTPQAVGGENIQ